MLSGTPPLRPHDHQRDLARMQVASGAHIGIVGRTGSGKSSLFLAFFRMVEIEGGSIVIDGKDTTPLGLHTVRKGLSMIPQDPFMFSGTVRRNLDPFGQYSDAEVWQALDRVTLKDIISEMGLKLEAPVSDNGGNFSQGQRQLFCLARALLRRSKVRTLSSGISCCDTTTKRSLLHLRRPAMPARKPHVRI